MGCELPTIKYCVLLFNTISAILGIVTIVVTSLALKNYHNDEVIIGIVIIVLAAIVFLISFFACFGVVRENICLTWTYVNCLLLVIIGHSIIAFKYLSQLDGETRAREFITTSWTQQLKGEAAMATIQSSLKCCGINNSTDYIKARNTIPNSCFVDGDYTISVILFPEGCLNKLIALYEMAEHWVTIFLWSSFCMEVAAFISACLLGVTIRNQKRRTRY